MWEGCDNVGGRADVCHVAVGVPVRVTASQSTHTREHICHLCVLGLSDNPSALCTWSLSSLR